jgi:hypothetical protein
MSWKVNTGNLAQSLSFDNCMSPKEICVGSYTWNFAPLLRVVHQLYYWDILCWYCWLHGQYFVARQFRVLRHFCIHCVHVFFPSVDRPVFIYWPMIMILSIEHPEVMSMFNVTQCLPSYCRLIFRSLQSSFIVLMLCKATARGYGEWWSKYGLINWGVVIYYDDCYSEGRCC